jgi:archaellum component FlaC
MLTVIHEDSRKEIHGLKKQQDKMQEQQNTMYDYLADVYKKVEKISSNKIEPMEKGVSFLQHKVTQLEKDVFDLKNVQ